MSLPFNQKREGTLLIREFSKNVDTVELVWHRDRLDRYVHVKSGTGWQLQIENKLPVLMSAGKTYFIPKHIYHRIMKGSDNLIIEIRESNGTRENQR